MCDEISFFEKTKHSNYKEEIIYDRFHVVSVKSKNFNVFYQTSCVFYSRFVEVDFREFTNSRQRLNLFVTISIIQTRPQ